MSSLLKGEVTRSCGVLRDPLLGDHMGGQLNPFQVSCLAVFLLPLEEETQSPVHYVQGRLGMANLMPNDMPIDIQIRIILLLEAHFGVG